MSDTDDNDDDVDSCLGSNLIHFPFHVQCVISIGNTRQLV